MNIKLIIKSKTLAAHAYGEYSLWCVDVDTGCAIRTNTHLKRFQIYIFQTFGLGQQGIWQ
jgi:hypothetical protein